MSAFLTEALQVNCQMNPCVYIHEHAHTHTYVCTQIYTPISVRSMCLFSLFRDIALFPSLTSLSHSFSVSLSHFRSVDCCNKNGLMVYFFDRCWRGTPVCIQVFCKFVAISNIDICDTINFHSVIFIHRMVHNNNNKTEMCAHIDAFDIQCVMWVFVCVCVSVNVYRLHKYQSKSKKNRRKNLTRFIDRQQRQRQQ